MVRPGEREKERAEVLRAVEAALRAEPRLAGGALRLDFEPEDGVLLIEGEVADIAAKKLALERAAAVPAVSGLVDRLRTTPAQPMEDKAILSHLRDALAGESSFAECALRLRGPAGIELVQDPPSARGQIEISAQDGVITLDGEVPSLSHKRLAEVLAWWVPGTRDVINGLGVEPPEEDCDEEITEATRLALEKDPLVNADQILVHTRDAQVSLEGVVGSEAEREMAELDAWYIFGVDGVINRLEVRPAQGASPPP